jgi:mutator protein MutT
VHVVGAAILSRGRCLAARRGPGRSGAGLWELPGGKLEPGEGPERALSRELHEELGLAAQVGPWLGRGEAIAGLERIVLDVYEVVPPRSEPTAREHDRLAWLDADELLDVAWTPADVPVLPAVRARLRAAPPVVRAAGGPVAFLCADWSSAPRGRAVSLATTGPSPSIRRLAPPPAQWSLDALLERARRVRDRVGGPVVVVVDAAIGLPISTVRSLGASGFLDALARLAAAGSLDGARGDDVAPFFRVLPGRGALRRHIRAAGGRSAIQRQLDLRTAANSVLALSGIPGTVGSGSRALWRELVTALDRPRDFVVWPFESRAAGAPGLVLAEGFPRAAYAVALAAELPAAPTTLAKTQRARRVAALDRLRKAPWRRSVGVELRDLGAARESEDDFDALLLATGLLRLHAEGRPLAHWLVDPIYEGGTLATGGVRYERVPPIAPDEGSQQPVRSTMTAGQRSSDA